MSNLQSAQQAPATHHSGAAAEHREEATALLSAAYFPPVQWFQKLHRHRRCVIDTGEHFVKQTYRNRCIIATANGTQTLTVPTERQAGTKTAMHDTRISDHGEWRHLHWNALVSAYGESPFFDYYADDLRPFFEERYESLAEFDIAITMKLCQLLDVRPDITVSSTYVDAEALAEATGHEVADFREAIVELPQWVKDGQRSPTGRHTFTTWKHWNKDDNLLPSGLIGPVLLRTAVPAK